MILGGERQFVSLFDMMNCQVVSQAPYGKMVTAMCDVGARQFCTGRPWVWVWA